jgi:hypothetical protein
MLRWLDSFDRYGTPQLPARYLSAVDATLLAGGGRRTGTSAALVPGAGQDVRLALTGTAALISGAAVFASTVTANTPITRLYFGGTVQCTLGRTPAGAVFVTRGDLAGPQLGISAAAVLTPDAYAPIAWQILPDMIVGASTVVVNGATVLTFANRNTAGASTPGYDAIGLCGDATAAQRFDDWYVLDVTGAAPNALLPDVRVDARPPMGPGSYTTWAPSDATRAPWQCVDDDGMPNDDGDYTETTIRGLADSFVPGAAPLPGAAIYGAQVSIVARQLPTPDGPAAIAPLVRQFGADVIAAAVPLAPATTYGYVTGRFTPPGGTPQSQAWYATLEFGYLRS